MSAERVGGYLTWPDPGGDDRVVICQRIEWASNSLHPLDGLVAELMVCVRPDCSDAGADRVTERLIRGLVGSGLDSGDLAEIVLAKEARP